jgi:hypothetical protein
MVVKDDLTRQGWRCRNAALSHPPGRKNQLGHGCGLRRHRMDAERSCRRHNTGLATDNAGVLNTE